MKSKRLAEMERYIQENGQVTMEELRDMFHVSMNTVRRDVSELCVDGSVRKVYGGVSARPTGQLVPFEVRSAGSSQEKKAIGREAARMIHSGDIIYIDSGTTTLHIMDYLQVEGTITVITNNIEVMVRAIADERIRLIVLPGELRRKTHSLTGEDTVQFLKNYNINIAFMAATGISASGVTNSSPLEYEIKRQAVEKSQRTVLLVTGNKFGVTSLLTYAQLDRLDAVITDAPPGEEDRAMLEAAGVETIIAAAGAQ